jgi:transcriptional regulator with XRE-family HTH domain
MPQRGTRLALSRSAIRNTLLGSSEDRQRLNREVVELTVAEQMRAARQERGWSLRELAERSGVGPRTLQDMEAGRRITLRNLLRVGAALGLPVVIKFIRADRYERWLCQEQVTEPGLPAALTELSPPDEVDGYLRLPSSCPVCEASLVPLGTACRTCGTDVEKVLRIVNEMRAVQRVQAPHRAAAAPPARDEKP